MFALPRKFQVALLQYGLAPRYGVLRNDIDLL